MGNESKKTAVTPRKASTVILIRNHEPAFQVFLVKRHYENAFMAGNFVFPGGKVDRGDLDPAILSFTCGLTENEARKILGLVETDMPGLAYYIAAIRELFEEAGVFFAYTEKGNLLSFENVEIRERFALHRETLQTGKKTFLQIIREERLTLAIDRLHYFSHWITPEARNIRFDTRFFLTVQPPCQDATSDGRENTYGVWMSPKEALYENYKGRAVLSPPTLKSLEDLSRFKTIVELVQAIPHMKKTPILPVLIEPSGDEVLIFPWDPEYELFRIGKISKPFDNGSLCSPDENSTRLVLKDGRLLPYVKK